MQWGCSLNIYQHSFRRKTKMKAENSQQCQKFSGGSISCEASTYAQGHDSPERWGNCSQGPIEKAVFHQMNITLASLESTTELRTFCHVPQVIPEWLWRTRATFICRRSHLSERMYQYHNSLVQPRGTDGHISLCVCVCVYLFIYTVHHCFTRVTLAFVMEVRCSLMNHLARCNGVNMALNAEVTTPHWKNCQWFPFHKHTLDSLVNLSTLGVTVDYTHALSLTTTFSLTHICKCTISGSSRITRGSMALYPHSEQFNELRNPEGPYLIEKCDSWRIKLDVC